MNLTCFYCQTPFTLSMDQKIAALRKMHAENLHHYDAHCPRCGRANAISRERLEMFTPGWEEAIKEPVVAAPAGMAAQEVPNTTVPSPVPAASPAGQAKPMAAKKAAPSRRRHAPAAKKAAKKAPAKKAAAKKAPAKKKSAAKAKKTTTKAKSKSSSRKSTRKR